MAELWTVAHRIEWTPILTFGLRRLKYLDWLEEHTDPVAFIEDEERVGVSLLDTSLKLTVLRSSAILSSGDPTLDLSHMKRALEGLFEVFEPRHCALTTTNALWTHEVSGVEYNEARARLAAQHLGAAGPSDLIRPLDTSALVDFDSGDYYAQVEFGIVNAQELEHRITDPRLGRLQSMRPAFSGYLSEGLPDVSVLADVTLRRTVENNVEGAEEILSGADEATQQSQRITLEITRNNFEGGDSNE